MPEEWKWRSIRLQVWMWDALNKIADRENRNQSEQVRHYIEEGLRRDGIKRPNKDEP